MQDIASFAGVEIKKIRALYQTGKLPPPTASFGVRSLRWFPDEIAAWLHKGRRPPGVTAPVQRGGQLTADEAAEQSAEIARGGGRVRRNTPFH